jgi:hypothetical protein
MEQIEMNALATLEADLKKAWTWFLGHEPTKAELEAGIAKVQGVADEAVKVGGVVAAIDPALAPAVATAAAADATADAAIAKVEKAVG